MSQGQPQQQQQPQQLTPEMRAKIASMPLPPELQAAMNAAKGQFLADVSTAYDNLTDTHLFVIKSLLAAVGAQEQKQQQQQQQPPAPQSPKLNRRQRRREAAKAAKKKANITAPPGTDNGNQQAEEKAPEDRGHPVQA